MNIIRHESSCWPTRQQELLLQAALLQGNSALDAWQKWKSTVDFDLLDQGSHRLLPLLYRNMRTHNMIDPLMNILKGVYRSTWYKNQLIFYNMATLLRYFHEAGIKTMILKGAALTLLYYKDYALRPMQDFDVMVPSENILDAINLLQDLRWTPITGSLEELVDVYLFSRHAYSFINAAGRECDLHWHLLYECLDNNADDDFWSGAISTIINNVPTYALNSADQLFHVCVHGVRWNYVPPLRWVADAMMILNTSPKIDWNRLIVQARKRHLILPLRDALLYLRDLLHAPLPSGVLQTIQNMPVSNIEFGRECVSSSGPSEPERTGWLGILPEFWSYYSRRAGSIRLSRRLADFIEILQLIWKLDHPWQVPFWAALKMMRRAWKMARWYKNRVASIILQK